MKPLGRGVRVWIGWTAKASPDAKIGLLGKGVISGGPWAPYEWVGSLQNFTNQTIWRVDHDDGYQYVFAEHLLTPIDDSDESETVESEDEVTA